MRSDRRRAAAIEDKVAFLASPGAYPEGSKSVDVKETHMSWIFLTDRYAYKLKKPVEYGAIDYTSIASRRRNCAREVRLNRRLAPDVYLGKVALTLDAAGKLHIGGAGRTVDWLIKMQRLAAARTLEHAIVARTLQPGHIDAIARRLAAFYRDARRIPISPEDYCSALETDIAANHRVLSRPCFALDPEAVDEVAAMQSAFMQRRHDLFAERVRASRIVEGHGDLRPEHIYLYDTPIVIDCLEFDRRLRTVDPAGELAFLAMECDRLGAGYIEKRLFEIYRRENRDDPPGLLVRAHKCFHAYLRARIAISHLDDAAVRQPLKWKRRTRQYLKLARSYARELGLRDVPRLRCRP